MSVTHAGRLQVDLVPAQLASVDALLASLTGVDDTVWK